MASDHDVEMLSKSESSVDIRELVPRDGPVTHNRYGSLVTVDNLLETQENLDEAKVHVETEVARSLLFDRFVVEHISSSLAFTKI